MDPWTYTAIEGGGTILQRFGTPAICNSSGASVGTHYFGLSSTEAVFSGMHNVRYKLYSSGKETISVFVNSQATSTAQAGPGGKGFSHAYEFAGDEHHIHAV